MDKQFLEKFEIVNVDAIKKNGRCDKFYGKSDGS